MNKKLKAWKERQRWEPHVRRDRTTEYKPPWDRISDETFAMFAALHPILFDMVSQLCLNTGWPGERAIRLVDRAVVVRKGQRKSTTRRARRQLSRLLGRRINYDKVTRSLVEAWLDQPFGTEG